MLHGAHPVPGRSVERLAWTFYTVAALGSSIGQIWVGVTTAPWPAELPWWARILITTPFAAVIDLGGVVASAFADWRQQLGETAYGWRILSAASVTVAVGINAIGHADVPYLAVVFGGLGLFAYSVWLLHSAARRRDALRATGKLDETGPDYGFLQWIREPTLTRRAKDLALLHGYGRHESLAAARAAVQADKQLGALAGHIGERIRSMHNDDNLADIAETTLPAEEIAARVHALAQIDQWAQYIGSFLLPPPMPTTAHAGAREDADDDDLDDVSDSDPIDESVAKESVVPARILAMVPTKQADYERWRELWTKILAEPDASNQDIAEGNGVHVRTIQRVRAVGESGILESPTPPARRSDIATHNGHPALVGGQQ